MDAIEQANAEFYARMQSTPVSCSECEWKTLDETDYPCVKCVNFNHFTVEKKKINYSLNKN
jgi:hypothetical protein